MKPVKTKDVLQDEKQVYEEMQVNDLLVTEEASQEDETVESILVNPANNSLSPEEIGKLVDINRNKEESSAFETEQDVNEVEYQLLEQEKIETDEEFDEDISFLLNREELIKEVSQLDENSSSTLEGNVGYMAEIEKMIEGNGRDSLPEINVENTDLFKDMMEETSEFAFGLQEVAVSFEKEDQIEDIEIPVLEFEQMELPQQIKLEEHIEWGDEIEPIKEFKKE